MFSCNFEGVYSTFLQALTATPCSFFIISFVTQGRLQKSFFFFTPRTIHYQHHPTCSIVGFMHRCIYTLQHIPEDDNFHLVCRQNQSLTLPLHCNTCRMEHLDHGNLSLCVLSTFSTYHGRTCLLSFLLSECFFARTTYLQLCMTLPRARMTK